MSTVEKITGCWNCPLLERNPDEGLLCNHPDADNVNIKGNMMGPTKTPDNCPILLQGPLTITF